MQIIKLNNNQIILVMLIQFNLFQFFSKGRLDWNNLTSETQIHKQFLLPKNNNNKKEYPSYIS